MGRLGFRQTIHAPEIAAIGNADPQVAQNAAVRIDQWSLPSHYCSQSSAIFEGSQPKEIVHPFRNVPYFATNRVSRCRSRINYARAKGWALGFWSFLD